MDCSVGFCLHNLKNILTYHADLISGAADEFEKLKNEVVLMKAILQDASRERYHGEVLKLWHAEMREVVCDAEDLIDLCCNYSTAQVTREPSIFHGSSPWKIRLHLAEEVNEFRRGKVRRVLDIMFENGFLLSQYVSNDMADQDTRDWRQNKSSEYIVGFEDEAGTLISRLLEESDKLETISITGMPGLGKTTLAWKIFKDCRMEYEFPVRIWVDISDDPNMKNVLLTILRKFTLHSVDKSVEELARIVQRYLEEVKFLIVMDDVWKPETWKEIEEFLPLDNKRGRVLITSRSKDVATHANPSGKPHNLRFLNSRESWELLQYKLYGQLGVVPRELEITAWTMALSCNGLPLSIVESADIVFLRHISRQNGSSEERWERVSTSFNNYLLYNPLLEKSISLSYTMLPFELRSCFLYLGVFPEDADIPVNTLTQLWIAEGFVRERTGKSLEQIARGNLKYLINQNLVIVKEAKLNGEPRICRVHVIIREFCKAESTSSNLNLFQQISKSNQGNFEPSSENIQTCRRLCIHSNVLEFFARKPKFPKARSFLSFHNPATNLDLKDISYVFDSFTFLRVYSAKNIRFLKFPPKFSWLIHLRYLTLGIANDQYCETLPETICNMRNLEVLIVEVSSKTIDIKANIWQLRQLSHLQTNAAINLKYVDSIGEGGGKLQTLSRLSLDSCNEKVFDKAKNLITLGIQGDLSSTQLESRGLEKLVLLNKLKLVHVVTGREASENPMSCLPGNNKFPPNLKVLVLVGTYLEWEQMAILGRLNNLEELKLKDNACRGESWDVNGGFKRLELLHVERSSDLKYWSTLDDAFPELRYLLLNYCERLVEVPFALGRELELLCMKGVTEEAIMCAEKIEKEKKGAKGGVKFKLDIAPGDRTRKD